MRLFSGSGGENAGLLNMEQLRSRIAKETAIRATGPTVFSPLPPHRLTSITIKLAIVSGNEQRCLIERHSTVPPPPRHSSSTLSNNLNLSQEIPREETFKFSRANGTCFPFAFRLDCGARTSICNHGIAPPRCRYSGHMRCPSTLRRIISSRILHHQLLKKMPWTPSVP